MANGYNQNNSWDPKGNFKSPRSKWAILIVVIVSIVLIGTGILLAYDTANGLGIVDSIFSAEKDLSNGLPTVTSISFDSEAIGMTANLNEVYVKMTYSDGSTRQVALSRLNPDGLDLTVEGKQNIMISYGGEKWPLKVEVVSSEITIKYVASDGGRIVGDATQVLPAGQNCSTVEAVPNEGYEFVGWEDKVMTAKRQEFAVNTDMEYRAIFARKTYRVRFKLSDGTWYSVPVEYGDNVPLPSEGTYAYQRYGYQFGGWDIDPEKLNNIQSNLDVYGNYYDYHADFRLYVTANSGVHKDGSGEYIGALGLKDLETSPYSHVNGSDNQTSEVSNTPEGAPVDRTALLYQGFYEYEDISQIKVVANPGAVLSKWLVLTAGSNGTWQEILPTESKELVVLSEGLDTVKFSSRVDYSTYTLAFSLNPTSSEKVLQVIAVMEYETNTISFEESSTIVGSVKLDYLDTLTLDGVADAIDPSLATVKRNALLQPEEYKSTGLPVLEKYGYTFAGWYKKNSTEEVTATTKFSEDTIVEARWEVNSFNVKFTKGQSDNILSETQYEIDYNSTIGTSFLTIMPEKANYTFVGWFEESNLDVAITASTLVLKDMTLVPVFKPTEHTFSVSVEGQTSLSQTIDSIKDSVYRLENVVGSYTQDTININSQWYYLFPSNTIISERIGTYQDYVISIDNGGTPVKSYYVKEGNAYGLSAIATAVVSTEGGVLSSVVQNDTTYYAREEGKIAINAGTYNVNRSILTVGENKYYISTNFTYQLRTIALSSMNVDSLTNVMTDFRVGDIVYYVDDESGNLYLNSEKTALAGSYNKATGIISLNSTETNYFADIDNKAIYQMSSIRAILTRDDANNLTRIELTNVAYDIDRGIAYQTVGSIDGNLLTLTEFVYFIDVDAEQLYTMTAISYQAVTNTMILDGKTYYIDGSHVLVGVGSKDGDIYNIKSTVYYAVADTIYELKEQIDASLIFDKNGIMTAVDFAGNQFIIDDSNYALGILLKDGINYYIYRGKETDVDTSAKIIYETNNYVYTFSWNENYQLEHLLVNGDDVKDSIVISTDAQTQVTTAILVLRYDATSPMIALDKDIFIDIKLVIKSFSFNITDNDDNNTAKYTLTGIGELTGESSYSNAINKGETVELDITAPKNMAIASVEINGVEEPITPNLSTFYKRFVNLIDNQQIVVTYETLAFKINVVDGGVSQQPVVKKYGETYSIDFIAANGTYIEKILFNGSVVNIYDCDFVQHSTIEVNGRTVTVKEIEKREERITKLTFTVEEVTKDIDIETSYKDIYYLVTTTVIGSGTLTTDEVLTVIGGETAAISIDYEIGYKIARYTVEKVENIDGTYIEYTREYTSIVTRFEGLDCDLNLTYYVEAKQNNIVFNTNSLVSIDYDGKTQSFDTAYQFVVNYNNDAEFVVKAPKGKYIASIVEGTNAYELPYNAQSFKVFKTQVVNTALITITLADLVVNTDSITIVDAVGGYASVEVDANNITLKIIPEYGYDVTSFTIKQGMNSPSTYVKGNATFTNVVEDTDAMGNVYYTYTFARENEDVTISPVFERESYPVVLKVDSTSEGQGGIYYGVTQTTADLRVANTEGNLLEDTDTAFYKEAYKVFFIAEEGSYIYEVKINGVQISFVDFEEHTIKSTNGKYSVGSITVNVTKSTTIEVIYKIDEFSVSIEAVGINTQEGDVWGSASVDKDKYSFGDRVLVNMQANTGWHITSMSINGKYIDSELFLKRLDVDLLKYNTTAEYEHLNINQNTSIIVYFEKNTYVLNYYAYNQSINYKDIDTEYKYYGSTKVEYAGSELQCNVISDGVTDAGDTMYKAVYRGIKHGESISIELSPYARNGYEITYIVLKLSSGSSETLSSSVFDKTKYIYDKDSEKLTINNIEEDIFGVEVYYARKLFEVSVRFEGDSAALTADRGFVFDNAQEESDPIVEKLGNYHYKVEYGINYRLTITPEESYKVVSCTTADGAEQAYVSIQGGVLIYIDGTISATKSIVVTYEKKTFDVTLVVNAGEEKLGTAGINGTDAPVKTVEYGTSLRIDLTPYTNKGGYISRFVVGGIAQNINDLVDSNGIYIYMLSNIKEDTVVQVFFEKQTFEVTYIANNDGGSVKLSYKNDPTQNWTGKIGWGDSVTVTINLNEHYEIKQYTFVGDDKIYDIIDDMYIDNSKSKIEFTIDNVKSNTTLQLNFKLKVFKAEIDVNNRSYGSVELYESGTLLNDNATVTSNIDITCTRDIVVYIKPNPGKIIQSVVFKMKTLSGTVSTLILQDVTYDPYHTDWKQYTVKAVTGDLSISVVYVDKQYSLSIKVVGEDALNAFDTFNINASNIFRNLDNYTQNITGLAYGSSIELSLYLKDGYDIDHLIINRRNYKGYLTRVTGDLNNFVQKYTLNDELINTLYDGSLVSGSGVNFTIELEIAIAKDIFTSVFDKQNVTNLENTDDVLTVSDNIEFIFNTSTLISASVKDGYEISRFELVDQDDNIIINLLTVEENVTGWNIESTTLVDGKIASIVGSLNINTSEKAVYTLDEDKATRWSVYIKEVHFVIEFRIKKYAQQAVEYVFDADTTAIDAGSTAATVSNTTANYSYMESGSIIPVTGAFTYQTTQATASFASNTVGSVKTMSLAAMKNGTNLSFTELPYGANVTIESSPNDDGGKYRFYGFEEYVNGTWIAVTDGNNGITFTAERKLTYTVYSIRIFRAVYETLYTISVESLPFHKSTSGIAPNINYVAYTGLTLFATDPFSGTAVYVDGTKTEDVAVNTYKVQFGANIVLRGSDTFTSGSTANRTSKVTYYNSDKSAIATASTPDNYSTSFVVDKNYDVVAVFENKVQLVLSYDSKGGETTESGGMVTVKNSKGQNIAKKGTGYYSYELTSAYQEIVITIAVNPYYRFDGFYSRVATNRNTTDNIVWDKDDYETIVTYEDIYKDINKDYKVDSDTTTYRYGDNYIIERNGDVITIRIFVVDNSMYRINYVKTFAIDTDFVNGYKVNGSAISAGKDNVALYTGGTSKALMSDDEMRYDYGSYLYMSLAQYKILNSQPADWVDNTDKYYQLLGKGFVQLEKGTDFEAGKYYERTIDGDVLDNTDQSQYQFIGWYLGYEDTIVKNTNLFKLSSGSYYDAYKYDYSIVLDDSVEDITDLKDKDRLKITAEYLPIYNVGIVRGFDYMDGAEGISFYYATSETSLATVVYESTDYIGNTDQKNDTESIVREVRTSTHIEKQAEYDRMSDIKMLTHIVDLNRGFSTTLNNIKLTALVNDSYQFNGWEISYDNITWYNIEDSSNSKSYTFELVKYIETNNIESRTFYFRPDLSKRNEVVVSKVVYYEKMNEMSTSSMALNGVEVYVGEVEQYTAGGKYGSTVTINASAPTDYRFLGWFDKTGKAVNNLAASKYATTEEAKVLFEKSGYENYGSADYYTDYTYELEARYIRTVTIVFNVVNASANGDTNHGKYAPFIYGVDSSTNTYIGVDKDGNEALRDIDSTSEYTAANKAQSVKITRDAGTYAVLKLTEESNDYGFDNTRMFRSGFAVGGNCYYNETDKYYTLFFNYDRNITVQYVTYGQVELTSALKDIKITLSKELGAVYKEGIDIAYTNGMDLSALGVNTTTYELTDPNGKYIVRVKENGQLEISTSDITSIILPYIKKIDYHNTEMQVSLSQMKSGYIIKDFTLLFSYNRYPSNDISIDLAENNYMPFARGLGTQSSPYIISKQLHLAAIEAVYTTTSGLADTASEPITINGLTYVTYITDPNLYSLKVNNTPIYFAMESDMPQSERYMSLGNWQAICRDGLGFDSVFNGNGWEIGNIVASPDKDYYGIFGKANGATFTEVDFMGGNDITADANYIGLLVGYAKNTSFYDINMKANNEVFLGGQKHLGTIKTKQQYIGVLAGYMVNCVVENVYLRLVTVVGEAVSVPIEKDGGEYETDDLGNIIYQTIGGMHAGGIAGYAIDTNIGSPTSTITIDNITVQGGSYIGGVVGEYQSSGTLYEITNITFKGNSSSFGVKNQSFNVGGIAGYMSENTRLSKIALTSSGVKFMVLGYYRHISQIIVETRTEEYLSSSAIGGLVGISYGDVDNIQLLQGSITMYGSIAGGFVGVNYGTARNLYIGTSGKVLFNTQYGGYYGGMIGFNKGFVNFARIGSFSSAATGLATNTSQIVTIHSNIEDYANVLFLSDGTSDVDGETYDNRNGIVHDTWGFNAMGGVIGTNSGILYNAVTYGKVVAYKRIMSGVTAHDALGGLVGMTYNSEIKDKVTEDVQIASSGSSYGIVINYSVLVSNSQASVVNYAAVGGVIGHHGLGVARGLFSYHTCVTNVYNTDSPGEEKYNSAISVGATGSIASSLANFAFGKLETSWAYYNQNSYAGNGYMFNVKLGNGGCTETASNAYVAYNSTTGGSPETDENWERCNILPTADNYHTYVGSTTGCVYHVMGKNFSSVAQMIESCTEGNAMSVPISSLFDGQARMYMRYEDGSGGPLAPNQYNSSPNKTTDWMIG